MPRFYVKRTYERTSAIRRANRERKHKVNQRLMHYGVEFVVRDGIYDVPVIPKNIRRLITVMEE